LNNQQISCYLGEDLEPEGYFRVLLEPNEPFDLARLNPRCIASVAEGGNVTTPLLLETVSVDTDEILHNKA